MKTLTIKLAWLDGLWYLRINGRLIMSNFHKTRLGWIV